MMKSLARLQALSKELPHSETRMPYTYHHDAIRVYTQSKCGVLPSRSDVAFKRLLKCILDAHQKEIDGHTKSMNLLKKVTFKPEGEIL